jgi:uncharacterized repeat protein (TIGR01451 family)
MKLIKSVIPIIPTLLALFFIFSTMGAISADGEGNDTPIVLPIDPTTLFNGYLTVSVNPQVANVGDTVTITVTATNNGLVDWCPLKIYMPVPDGLQYMSFVVPDRNLQNYNPSTGIWDVYRMRCIERGQQKTAILTAKVLPAAAGKNIKATARFDTLVLEGYGIHMENRVAAARADTLTILSKNDTDNGNGNGTGNGTGNGAGNGTGNGNGNGTGSGADLIDTLGNAELASAIGNLTASDKNNPLQNLQTGGGGGSGNKKANEVNVTTPQAQDNTPAMYILAVLLIIGLLAAGYFYGIKREE